MPRVISDGSEYGYTEEEWMSFNKAKRWRIRNPEKMKEAVKNWADNNKERRWQITRDYFLKRDYGLTEADYQQMLEEQKRCCAICGTDTPTGKWKVFAVDHDHRTGFVRGLLCNECNRGMGLLKDNVELLIKSAQYLSNAEKRQAKERRANEE